MAKASNRYLTQSVDDRPGAVVQARLEGGRFCRRLIRSVNPAGATAAASTIPCREPRDCP